MCRPRRLTRRLASLGPVTLLLLLAPVAPARAELPVPTWWIGLSLQMGIDVDGLDEVSSREGGAVLAGGVNLWRMGGLLAGVEGEGSAGRLKQSIGDLDETVDIWRARAGVRVTWWEEDDSPLVVPYLRGGGVFRADRANLSDDSGFGWYVGGGLNLMLNERWALGVSVTYERVSMRDETKSLLLGIGLSYHY
jgi:hypothetical protein